jgi:RNA polymerase sigma-70 factor (family 1)
MNVAFLHSVESFEAFFEVHHARICYYARLTVADTAIAEDIAQEAFANLWEIRKQFENETAAKAWLYKVVHHKALNHLRHEKVKIKKLPMLTGNESDEQNYLNSIIKSEALGEIYQAIETLPEGCKRIFKLAYFEGLKNQEIADLLQISPNTVKTHKARALQLLRLKIDPSVLGIFLLYCRFQSGFFN